jgi:hypothetical protein
MQFPLHLVLGLALELHYYVALSGKSKNRGLQFFPIYAI